MNLVFNELSSSDLAIDSFEARQRVSSLLVGCNQLFQSGFERLTVSDRFFETLLATDYTINEWLADPDTNSIEKNLLPGIIRYPYIDEPEENNVQIYISNKIILDEPEHPKHGIEGEGLATCWIKNELSISFNSHLVWNKSFIGLNITPDVGEDFKAKVPNICTAKQLNEGEEIRNWFIERSEVVILSIADLKIKYPAEHYYFSNQSLRDIDYWIKQNYTEYIEKIENLLKEIKITPFNGKGKPEPLKGNLSGWWSRRISDEDRLVYQVNNDIIHISTAKGHYEN